jgi:chromosome segregation ATPase
MTERAVRAADREYYTREIADLKAEMERLRAEVKDYRYTNQEVIRQSQEAEDKLSKYRESLHQIRARLGDFQDCWSDREKDVDEIAKTALADTEGRGDGC